MAAPISKTRRWIIFSVAVFVSASFSCLVYFAFSGRERVCRVSIGFVGYTDKDGHRYAVFLATNNHARPLQYSELLEQKEDGGWPNYIGRVLPHKGRYDVGAGEDFYVLSDIPTDDVPWRVSISYYVQETGWSRIRWRVAEPLYNSGLNTAASLVHKGYYGFIVTGPEMRTPK